MKRKIILGLAALGTALAVIPMFAAFEAHVINVTAKIENALAVSTDAIDFGTVFPQEQLDKNLDISLSQSFLDEPEVDDVNYIIRQKPKCGVTTDNGTVLVGPTATGHVNVDPASGEATVDCGEAPRTLEANESWGQLPLLCSYLSKHDLDPDDQNDDAGLDAFHEPWTVENGQVVWNDVRGRLAKSQNDTEDSWNIDLKVPCFGGNCAQDWEAFVAGINPDANPEEYIQPIENEHKIFGCDLWVEVTGVSRIEQPGGGEEDTTSISLENKDGSGGWLVIQDGTYGTLTFVSANPTFNYTLTAQGLQANTEYSLIYYADPWPGNNPGALIGTHTTDGSGNINGAGDVELNMDLPDPADANYPNGAKIWLVPSSDYNGTDSMTVYNETDYLFEYNTIIYDDTDI